MADLLKDSDLLASIEKLINEADEYIWLISPYIKLHDRIKDKIRTVTRDKPGLTIVVVFGKNEDDANKSMSKEDVDFFKGLPNVEIYFERRLHAKFYSNEKHSIVSSMNLHQYSQNNNIEVGVRFDVNKSFLSNGGIEQELYTYFYEVIENATQLFVREPVFESKMFGLSNKYTHSDIKTDNTSSFFKQSEFNANPTARYKRIKIETYNNTVQQGFCIRTGKPIPFNLQNPMTADALKSWNQFRNPDYKEKFCHKTGQPSNGKTSMRNPVL